MDSTPIQKLIYTSCGNYIYAASNEGLKVCMVQDEKEADMVDNVESSWRGILDLNYD